MSRFFGMLRKSTRFRAELAAMTGLPLALRSCAGRMALAGLVAGSMLLAPAMGEAATQNAKRKEPAVTPAPGNGPKKVSPYAIANRRRLEAGAKERDRSKKGAPAHLPPHPVRIRKN